MFYFYFSLFLEEKSYKYFSSSVGINHKELFKGEMLFFSELIS